MPYYLSSYIGQGTRQDPFRPRGSEQPGWSAIDIRPDASKRDGGGLNTCLLYLPQHDPSLYRIADEAAEVLGSQVHKRASSLLHLAADKATQLREFVADLLMAPPSRGWNPIQPEGRHPLFRRYRVYLGGLLWDQPVLAGGTTLTETWSTADSNSLDSDLTWNEYFFNGVGWTITSNKARLSGNANSNQELCLSTLSTTNMDISATIKTFTNASVFLVVVVTGRVNPSVTSTSSTWDWYGYGPTIENGVSNQHNLEKYVAGTQTILGSDTTDVALNEIIKLRCSGSSISGLLNGLTSVSPVTDSSHSGSTSCGFYGYSNGVSNTVEIDDWTAADIVYPARPMFRGS